MLTLTAGFGQAKKIRMDSLPAAGIVLQDHWHYIEEDSIQFAEKNYDDRHWKPIDPTRDIFELAGIPRSGKIFWLRQRLQVSDSTYPEGPVLLIRQSGASEIYANGTLIRKTGILSSHPENIIAKTLTRSPLSLRTDQAGQLVIAVRYALEPGIHYGTHFSNENPLFQATLTTLSGWQQINKLRIQEANLNTIIGSIDIILCMSFALLFFVYRKEKVYFLLMIYTLVFALSYGYSGLFQSPGTVKYIYWISNVLVLLSILGSICLLLALYKIVKTKPGFIFYALLLLGIACIPLSLLVYRWGWMVFGIGFNLLNGIEIFRTALVGIKHKINGSKIIAIGGITFFALWILFLSIDLMLGYLSGIAPYFYALSQLCMPISVAYYLGFEFAQTNKVLATKLDEVETLSKEKQDILATQNERLEKQVEIKTNELRASQAQLIQSEKMASLGELTVGIAHEIQNPLNFVNNFSELSAELTDELKSELDHSGLSTSDKDKLLSIADDLIMNQQKIIHHGKRAEGIVKAMLQHSQKVTGEKEPTDINKLVSDCLALCRQEFQGKNPSINVTLRSTLGEHIPTLQIVPQDIQKVLLNVLNNAFYAVHQKHKSGIPGYEPTVEASTSASEKAVAISIVDNGPGIEKRLINKVLQPFFTTKPTGEGTGLGLSLSHDIVKSYGGDIRLETQEGAGTSFIITLPING